MGALKLNRGREAAARMAWADAHRALAAADRPGSPPPDYALPKRRERVERGVKRGASVKGKSPLSGAISLEMAA